MLKFRDSFIFMSRTLVRSERLVRHRLRERLRGASTTKNIFFFLRLSLLQSQPCPPSSASSLFRFCSAALCSLLSVVRGYELVLVALFNAVPYPGFTAAGVLQPPFIPSIRVYMQHVNSFPNNPVPTAPCPKTSPRAPIIFQYSYGFNPCRLQLRMDKVGGGARILAESSHLAHDDLVHCSEENLQNEGEHHPSLAQSLRQFHDICVIVNLYVNHLMSPLRLSQVAAFRSEKTKFTTSRGGRRRGPAPYCM